MRRPDTKYASVGGAEVAYQVFGDGPIDLVYHHGMCHLDFQWDVPPEAAFNQGLASFSRLILFDRRGSGASARPTDGFFPTAEAWNEDLLAVLDAVGSERAAIFAESEAGPTAIRFAVAHADRVQALVLGNTAARFLEAPGYPHGLSPAEAEQLLELMRTGWGDPGGMALMFPLLADDTDVIEAVARLTRGAATPAMAVALYRHVWKELDVREDLAAITVPTLVLRNDNRGIRYLAEHIPGARVIDVANDELLFFTGDFPPVIDEVATFLTGKRLTTAPARILTTVLFTDLVGSTRRAAAEGDARWRALLDTHDRITRELLGEFDGVEVNTTGDGFVARFDRPTRAIACARALTAALADAGLPIRAGLHAGECEARGDDLAGLAVHIAARVGAQATPGEVLVSRTVTDLVAGSGLAFEDRGEAELDGIPGRWGLFAAVAVEPRGRPSGSGLPPVG